MSKLLNSIAGWGVNIAIAMTALRTNLMRSILTTLGVMIGVFSVILAVAVGNGAQVSVTQQIATLGSNMAIVVPQPLNRARWPRHFASGIGRERCRTPNPQQRPTGHTGPQRHHTSDWRHT
jgi:ABC-type lipoprotein release transport system permease subunit